MTMKQRITIIGGGNFVGRRIATLLAASDWAMPIAVDERFETQAPWNRIVRLSDRAALTSIVAASDGIVSATMGSPSHIVSTMQILADIVQQQARPLRLVHISSMTVYGGATGLVSETTQAHGELSSYAAARLEAERLTHGLPEVVTLRPGCEYGPECVHWSERVALWLRARRLGDLGAAGDGYCNLTYIDDIAEASVRALRTANARGQTFNIATDTPPTWNEYFTRFAISLNAVPVRRVTARRLKFETKLLSVPLKLSEIATAPTGLKHFVPPAIPPSLLALCRQEIRLDVSRAQEVLGMAWTPVADGLAKAAAAFGGAKA